MQKSREESASIPKHVGIILDGNRRWATLNNLPKMEGHRQGYSNLKTIVKHAVSRGVSYISAYVFSTENWNRSKEEVSYLMDLALWVATKEVKELHKEGIRILYLGSKEKVSDKLLKAITKAETLTEKNTKATLGLCFNYGGHQEIIDAMRKIIDKKTPVDQVDANLIGQNLYAPDIPNCDLIIRTSGEQRLSNFMLWRAAYAELLFVDKHWPDFSAADFDNALDWYALRQRRFGA